MVTKVMKLTRGKLMKQSDWSDWNESEHLQLDQYDKQFMFGDPVPVDDASAIFHLVWTYAVKELDGRKKARCVCDGSSRSGQVRVLDHTYANCVDRTGSRIFYAISAAENMLVYGADVSNAFAEAPPPKQGFFIYPDRAFNDWWVNKKGKPPIPDGHVIPILGAMQGHPESPRLWEKHIDRILRDIGLTPTIHEPCIYSGLILGERVLFMRQVDDFAISASAQRIANHVLDLIDDKLTIPMKRQGLVTLYNGLDIIQTRDYIKVSCETYIDRISNIHLDHGWMKSYLISDRPTPLPTTPQFMKALQTDEGDPDPITQRDLEKKMGFSYRSGIGQLVYAMVCCRPDLSFATVKLSQHNTCPGKVHFEGVRHALKYLYQTRSEGLYFWRTTPRPELESIPLPTILSTEHDLLRDKRQHHDALDAHGMSDADWASCIRTRRSFTGSLIKLAGAAVAYKTQFQDTVATSSTESEFMAAYELGKALLYVRSILWDLDVPQEAASRLYEDNDACTAMANAQKPTSRTRHMDIRYHVLCEWVERDLIVLERVDTTINEADHFTKLLSRVLFHRHIDYIMGHVPPEYSLAHAANLRLRWFLIHTQQRTLSPPPLQQMTVIFRLLLEQHIFTPQTTALSPTIIGLKLLPPLLVFPTTQCFQH